MIEELYKLYLASTGICTDTRKLQPGNLFFALKGPNFNGNEFAQKALEGGAIAIVVDEVPMPTSQNVFNVHNVLTTLQKLAHFHRKKLAFPIIGIAGSNGKTTTKELTAAVLSTQYTTFSTPGNLNNHIGVPLCLLMMNHQTQIAVLELGANHVGELAALCAIAEPNYGLITNNGLDHLEGYGSFEGVVQGNSEIYDWLLKNKGTAFVNANDELLMHLASRLPTCIFYGNSNSRTYALTAENKYYIKIATHFGGVWNTQLAGDYNLPNLNAALAIGVHFGISAENCKKAIENYTPANNRSQWVQKGDKNILVDCYNANPSSVEVAMASFAQIEADNKVLFLGDMFELGQYAHDEHVKIVQLALQLPFSYCIFCGEEFFTCSHKVTAPQAHFFTSRTEAEEWITHHSEFFTGSTWLIKGSRGMQMEKFLDSLPR